MGLRPSLTMAGRFLWFSLKKPNFQFWSSSSLTAGRIFFAILIIRSGELVLKYATNIIYSQRSPCRLCHSSHITMSAPPPLPSKRSLESVPLYGNKQRGRLRVQLSPEATQLERSDAIQKVKASLLAKSSSSMTTTANQRAAQRASVLINLLGGGGSIFTTELVLFDVGQF